MNNIEHQVAEGPKVQSEGMTVQKFLEQNEKRELLRLSTAGSIDDGKSTLIGRLLYDSKNIFEDQVASVKKVSRCGDDSGIDFALITDGLKAEREQGITIDVAYRYFSTPKRKFIIADTPGHVQYTRNMATGASTANLAVVLVDARNGVLPQTRRHAFISSLLGVPHMLVAVNKMDLVGYSEDVFLKIKHDFTEFSRKLHLVDLRFIPISALKGDNVVNRSEKMPFYKGESLLEIMENIHIASDKNLVDLRFPVQYVLRPHQNFRGYCGQVASGVIRVGDEIVALPSMKMSKVKSIVSFDGDMEYAFPPMSVAIRLEDEIDVSRGDVLVHRHNLPRMERHFEGMVVWMGDEGMDTSRPYRVKMATQMGQVRVDKVHYSVDVDTLSRVSSKSLNLNEMGRVVFTSSRPMFFDSYKKNQAFGSFIIIDTLSNNTVGAGMIIDSEPSSQLPVNITADSHQSLNLSYRESRITEAERFERLRQRPHTIWLTGLVSSGKTEVAYALEKRLFDMCAVSVVLDGENVRLGLSRHLDFDSLGQAEHLRRVAETARILNEAGIIAVCAFTSPLAEIRKNVAEIVGTDRFVEVYLQATPEWCEAHDSSGLYKKAREGQVTNLAGVNVPYESPEEPSLLLPMAEIDVEEAASRILRYVQDRAFFHIK